MAWRLVAKPPVARISKSATEWRNERSYLTKVRRMKNRTNHTLPNSFFFHAERKKTPLFAFASSASAALRHIASDRQKYESVPGLYKYIYLCVGPILRTLFWRGGSVLVILYYQWLPGFASTGIPCFIILPGGVYRYPVLYYYLNPTWKKTVVMRIPCSPLVVLVVWLWKLWASFWFVTMYWLEHDLQSCLSTLERLIR